MAGIVERIDRWLAHGGHGAGGLLREARNEVQQLREQLGLPPRPFDSPCLSCRDVGHYDDGVMSVFCDCPAGDAAKRSFYAGDAGALAGPVRMAP